jgi:hypothetical protein
MTTTSNTNIHKILVQAVLDSGLGLPIAWPNLPFLSKPANGGPWANVNIIPIDDGVRAVTLGLQGEDQHLGLLQIDVNYPMRQGEASQLGKMDTLATFFRGGAPFEFGQARLWIRAVARTRGREVDGFWRMTLTIDWMARVPRNPELLALPDWDEYNLLLTNANEPLTTNAGEPLVWSL